MNRLLTFLAIFAASLFAGCMSNSQLGRNAATSINEESLAILNTAELEARHAALKAQIVTIEREVEMKAGLHMGIAISDERGRLSELYREAKIIEQELLRRSAYTKL